MRRQRIRIAALCAFSLLLVESAALPCPSDAQRQPQSDLREKGVLVLHAFESNVPIFELTDRGLRAALHAGGVGSRNQFFEYLDLARNPGPEHKERMADLMRLRYGHPKIDAIITVFAEAFRFLLEEGRTIFPDVPIVALWMPVGFEPPKVGRRVILHAPKADMAGTLGSALRLLPGAKRVYIVGGVHETDRAAEDQARREFKKWEDLLDSRYLNRMPLDEILTTVSTAPTGTIVLMIPLAMDVTGRVFTIEKVSRRVSQVSSALVLGLFQLLWGDGIVVGSLFDHELVGTRAGKLALDILRGAKASGDLPAFLEVPSWPMFDWRLLRRWDLSEKALPAGSTVINREFTLWDLRYYALGILVFLAAQSVLVATLLVQKRRRKSAEESLLRKTEELERCMDFNHPHDVNRTREAVLSLETQQTVQAFENRHRCKGGSYRWLQCNATPVEDLICTVDRDVTEDQARQEALGRQQEQLEESVRRRTEELETARDEAQIASQAKTAFLANMSHELRTPLNSILGVTQLLESDAAFQGSHTELLRILDRSGRHLLELIDDVLEMSKIEAGQIRAVNTGFDLPWFLEDLHRMMEVRARAKGLQLAFHRHPGVPRHVWADERKLRQILINLIGNAIKFTEEGRVLVRTSFTGGAEPESWGNPPPCAHPEKPGEAGTGEPPQGRKGRLAFEVEDTGVGIAPQDLERIFEPFVQVRTPRGPSEGTGLGLALSRSLVALLGGGLTARSQLGKGSVFGFHIQVSLPEDGALLPGRSAKKALRLAPGQPLYEVLLVDDDADSRSVFGRFLEQAGFQVREAGNGQEALEMHATRRADLILMDLRMPVMDGHEAAWRIRAAEREGRDEDGKGVHTPIIAVTAHVIEKNGSLPLLPDFDGLLRKPVDANELLQEIGKCLDVKYVDLGSDASGSLREGSGQALPLTAAQLSVLPRAWLEDLRQASRTGLSGRLHELIGGVEPAHADLAGVLTQWTRSYRFDWLAEVTEEALKERSDG